MARPRTSSKRLEFQQRALEVGHRLVGVLAHPRDDLDAGVEQLVLGFRVFVVRMLGPDDAQDLVGDLDICAGCLVHHPVLHLHAEARAFRGNKIHAHGAHGRGFEARVARGEVQPATPRRPVGDGPVWGLHLSGTMKWPSTADVVGPRSPSSSGLGLRPFKAAARVRIPLGARGTRFGLGWTSKAP